MARASPADNDHAFTGWALEEAVIGCGVELKPNFLG
jgi:hypothetical protein